MAMAVGPAASPSDGATPAVLGPAMMPMPMPMPTPMTVVSDALAKDAIIGWYRGEFAAANAIIDALCGHLAQLSGANSSEYSAAFAAIHRRRANWIPVLQMQKYHSIADVMVELRNVGAKKEKEMSDDQNGDVAEVEDKNYESEEAKSCLIDEKEKENESNDAADEGTEEDGSPDSDITDSVV